METFMKTLWKQKDFIRYEVFFLRLLTRKGEKEMEKLMLLREEMFTSTSLKSPQLMGRESLKTRVDS